MYAIRFQVCHNVQRLSLHLDVYVCVAERAGADDPHPTTTHTAHAESLSRGSCLWLAVASD